jgi:hypothetical protein
MRGPVLALIATLALGAPALAAAPAGNDGFAAFWTAFTAALAKNDRAAATSMMKPDTLGNTPGAAKTLDQYYTQNFGPRVRACLVKQRPERDVHDGQVSYAAFCGEAIYAFYKVGGAWKLTDIGAND